ncbi:MAG: LPXTG cell wall anchor domain-containing protein [Clostridiales bacterium]|nr:LPXTG cell wall anchor domain-containing protein [Clostridiales bacterium]
MPETGGIGTTIFYVLGAVLVVGAGVVLVTKKRMG